jgi:hypothetical protein
MFVTLDTKKTNYKNVGKINHGDDLILELTVLSDGDMISFNDPMVDLLVKKSDGKMIRQNSGIEHIKPNKFVIEVSKDCVTSPGLTTNQLIINDNGRISTCMFYYTILNSLEEDIIQSISSVEVLEQLDEYVIEAHERIEMLNNDINELEELFGATSDKLVEAEMARNEAEQNRVQSEILRVNNENDRIEADNIRNQNDSIRNQNEVDRSSSELVREQRESERILNEEERRQNESERMIDESTRQQNENTRQSNESIRMSNETDRKTQENRRVTAETNRVNAETTRRNNENSRISNENERKKAMNEMKSLLEDAREFDERIRIIEDEIEETNSSLEHMASDIEELKQGDIEIDLTDYAKKSDLEVKADKSYVDSNIKNTLNSKADKSELHSHSNKSVLDGITSSKVTEWNNKSTFDGNYNSLANKPTIPIKTSQLNNDSGFITSIPSEYVTETELDNINSSLEDIENDIEYLKQNVGGSLVPSYVINESESVAEKVLGVRNSDSFVIACASDLHTTGLDTSAIGITHMGMAMNEINKITQLDLVVIFGDIIVNRFDNNYKKGFKHVKKSIDDIRKAVPYIQMQGNHDELSTDTTEQGRQKYYAYIGANNVGVTTDYSNKFRNYGYKDFDNYKMRVIYLNSADVSDGEITTDVNISYEQFNWFINTALDFSGKDGDWWFIVCTHHPLNWVSECMPNLLTILDSYKGKTSGSINVSGKSIAYNFTTTKATLIAHFHGHLHNFRSETLGTNKVLSITIPNACFDRNNEYGTSPSYSEELHIRYGDIDENGVQRQFNKTSASADDTAFDIVVIDCLNSMIHCFNYGAGIDRTIDFNGTTGVNPEPPSGYTNVIETIGYTNNVRISTSNGATKPDGATGYTTTGFIEVKEGDIIRTSGVDMRKSANQYCSYAIFDSNKTKTGTGYLDVINNTALTTSFDSNGNLTLTCGVGFNAVKSYLRLCGFGDGANLIVTVNQEIT